MNTNEILSELRTERQRLDTAIAALESLNGTGAAGAKTIITAPTTQAAPKPRIRRISAAGRKRISEAAKLRWARQKNDAARTTTKKGTRHISPEGRRRMAEAARKMWAKRRKKAKS